MLKCHIHKWGHTLDNMNSALHCFFVDAMHLRSLNTIVQCEYQKYAWSNAGNTFPYVQVIKIWYVVAIKNFETHKTAW